MAKETVDPSYYPEWIKNPEMLVALSALLLSVCGLALAIYEASLIRQAQRASVWPHVEVGASLTAEEIKLWVENTGVGPARVQSAVATMNGETLADWEDLLDRLAGGREADREVYFSIVNGRVLPSNAPETILAFSDNDDPVTEDMMARFRQAILGGALEVTLCYCSVYDECWNASLQDLMRRSRGGTTSPGARRVERCDAISQSAI